MASEVIMFKKIIDWGTIERLADKLMELLDVFIEQRAKRIDEIVEERSRLLAEYTALEAELIEAERMKAKIDKVVYDE
jgi:hypothetical protein